MSYRGRTQYTQKYIEESHNMLAIIEVVLGKETLEECRIIEVQILEVDIR